MKRNGLVALIVLVLFAMALLVVGAQGPSHLFVGSGDVVTISAARVQPPDVYWNADRTLRVIEYTSQGTYTFVTGPVTPTISVP